MSIVVCSLQACPSSATRICHSRTICLPFQSISCTEHSPISLMYFSRWLGYLYSHYLLIASLIWAHELLPIDNLVTHIGVYIFFILFYFPLISIGVTIFINIYYYGEYEFVILQTSKLALLGIRAQIVSLAVFNVSSIILLNKESLYPVSLYS